MRNIYITGDRHGDFDDIYWFCHNNLTTTDDTLIILGDAGINYYVSKNPNYPESSKYKYKNSSSMKKLKKKLNELPIILFSIQGNHEARPETIDGYKEKEWNGGIVYYEEKYPNLLFAKDGEIYDFNGHKTLVIGGAYSVDKDYRLKRSAMGYEHFYWFEEEQPSNETKDKVLELMKEGKEIDVILTHTCPLENEPKEVFLDFVDQTKVDKSTEIFLDEVSKNLNYKKWYCGHFHTTNKKLKEIRENLGYSKSKNNPKLEFMYTYIKIFMD